MSDVELEVGERKETKEISLAEALASETEAIKALVEAGEEIPVYMDWNMFQLTFPVVTAYSEYGARLGWFSLAKCHYGFLSKMAENHVEFSPEVKPRMKAVVREVKKVFPGAKGLRDLSNFFTIGGSEVTIIGLANDLGAPELLTPDTAPFLFGHLPLDVRSKVLDKIGKKIEAPVNELKSVMGFSHPIDDQDFEE